MLELKNISKQFGQKKIFDHFNLTIEDGKILSFIIPQNHGRFKKILNIENRLAPKLDLTKRDGVKKYLDISDSTLYQMMNDGRLKQNIHYKKTINGKRVNIIFVESAIVGFKENQK